jgi:hypothetical protein
MKTPIEELDEKLDALFMKYGVDLEDIADIAKTMERLEIKKTAK